ncbi:MAG: hypothetical protein DIZ80_10320 [endosymbiont of Galathealinum brachiosum]|uniref:Thiol:disulfide interchange protein n=1 Tax=endosymbiont of Galathealinum brachiosum TaxID=2200906 RepID=A0A370DCQ0_9GAMM|nr:MAG: hypothetical protein DIZ80_10320 [endosymbiont of Galathealinum brachiosum]
MGKKMHFIKKISLLALLFLLPALTQAQNYEEGKSYSKLAKPVVTQSGDKIEILEFFWYGCPHCFSFEPTLKKWRKDLPANVTFTRVPAPLNKSWMPHTKTYYALQIMGEDEKHHEAIFSEMHVKKQKLRNKEDIADFLATRGVDKKTFLSTFSSFAVEMRANQANQLGIQYRVNGVPMLTVNGKYTVSGSQAGSYIGMVKISDHLINKESK